jgi:hypothetical protein
MTKNEKARAMLESRAETSGMFSSVRVDKHGSSLHVSLERNSEATVSFGTMDVLSQLFKTKKIDVAGGSRSTGFCESCAGTESFVGVEIYDAVV